MPDLGQYAQSRIKDYKELVESGGGILSELVEAAGEKCRICEQIGLSILKLMPSCLML